MRNAAGTPFFLYVAHPMPHIPIATSEAFHGHSLAGRYGDVIEELDWSVGQILGALTTLDIDRNTIVVFTSDNGAWLNMAEQVYERGERGNKVQGDVGWSGLLRGSKGSTWEGGIRTPAIIRWPAVIAAGRVSPEIVSILDLYPTFMSTAGGRIADGPATDGQDILPLLRSTGASPRKELFYFLGAEIQAVRDPTWKLRIGPPEGAGRAGRGAAPLPPVTELFNLQLDPAERHNVAAVHPEIVSRLRARMDAFRQELSTDKSPR
jgi:uncharacterized sulfatase